MDLGLRDRVFIVTGGSRGLGFAAAQALVAEGARVVLSAPHEATAAAAVARLTEGAANPWDEITTPQALRDLNARAGIAGADALAVPAQHELDSPDRFWDVALGTGYRATIDALSGDQRELLRDRVLGRLRVQQVTTLQTGVVFGTAARAGDRA